MYRTPNVNKDLGDLKTGSEFTQTMGGNMNFHLQLN